MCALAIRRRKGRRLSFRKLKPREALLYICMCSNINTNTHAALSSTGRRTHSPAAAAVCFYSVNDLINTNHALVSIARARAAYLLLKAHISSARPRRRLPHLHVCSHIVRRVKRANSSPSSHISLAPAPSCTLCSSDECWFVGMYSFCIYQVPCFHYQSARTSLGHCWLPTKLKMVWPDGERVK